jgi:hypothetical protein
MGDSVQDALDLGFERIISIEVDERFTTIVWHVSNH